MTQARINTAIPDRLTKVYELSAAGYDRAANRELMTLIIGAQQIGNFKEIDTILLEADVTKMSVHALNGLVRSSFAVRVQLPNWQQTYERAWTEVKNRNKDPKSLFVGLEELYWL